MRIGFAIGWGCALVCAMCLASAESKELTEGQRRAVDRLIHETGVAWIWLGDQILQPRHAPPPLFSHESASATMAARAALAFITRHRAIWQIRAPWRELRLQRFSPVYDGAIIGYVLVLAQSNGGLPVMSHGIVLTFDAHGQLVVVNSSYVPGLDELPKMPRLSAQQVAAIVEGQPMRCHDSPCLIPHDAASPSPELKIRVNDDPVGAKLVYVGTREGRSYIVDADTGNLESSSLPER